MKPVAFFKCWRLRMVLLWLCAGALQAQTVAPLVLETPSALINERIEVLAQPFERQSVEADLAQPSLTRLVFYRHPAQAGRPQAISVYVNGQLHSALVVGGYNTLCLRAEQVELRARQGQRSAQAALAVQQGQTRYITVTDTDGQLSIEEVAPEPALALLAQLRLQVHGLSRVSAALPCEGGAEAPGAATNAAATTTQNTSANRTPNVAPNTAKP